MTDSNTRTSDLGHALAELEEAKGEIERLRVLLADAKADYLRRHNDACDRWMALKMISSMEGAEGMTDALFAERTLDTIRKVLANAEQ